MSLNLIFLVIFFANFVAYETNKINFLNFTYHFSHIFSHFINLYKFLIRFSYNIYLLLTFKKKSICFSFYFSNSLFHVILLLFFLFSLQILPLTFIISFYSSLVFPFVMAGLPLTFFGSYQLSFVTERFLAVILPLLGQNWKLTLFFKQYN